VVSGPSCESAGTVNRMMAAIVGSKMRMDFIDEWNTLIKPTLKS
jgi:hypothetical protein